MSYTSLIYILIFLPAVMFFYRAVPKTKRWIVLLCASYLFYLSISKHLIIYLLATTAAVRFTGLWLGKCTESFNGRDKTGEDKKAVKKAYIRKKRLALFFGVAINAGALLFVKYFNFFITNINLLTSAANLQTSVKPLVIFVPLGISFYTLQAIAYLTDVYREKIEPDRNWGRLALFMSFFPCIMEGPICRYSQTAEALYEGRELTYGNLCFGMQRIIWGFFKKLVVADRLDPLVKTVFNNYSQYGGLVIIVGAIGYTFMLYADFSGCIDVSLGTAEIFGIKLPENFRQPFFSKTASEFWRRWHISLGAWFKDYIFYPLSLSKPVKQIGKISRKHFGNVTGPVVQSILPLFAVWMLNGLWHGSGWNYLFFGAYYFVLIFAGNMAEPFIEKAALKLNIDRQKPLYKALQSVKTLVIIFTGEMFFRASTVKAGFAMFTSIFTRFNLSALTDGSLLKLGLSFADTVAVVMGLCVMLAVGIAHEKGINIREKIASRHIAVRWCIYYIAIFAVLIFGAYGDGYTIIEAIYAGF